MKRDHKHSRSENGIYGGAVKRQIPSPSSTKSSKMWQDDDEINHQQHDAGGGEDEHLAVLGYNVRASEMADVAQKLEQLEMVMVSSEEEGISHLSSNTVHYNPSDLSAWVQSMLSELNSPLQSQQRIDDPILAIQESNSVVFKDDSEYDLRAIPGVAAYPPSPTPTPSPKKRLKKSVSDPATVSGSSEPSRSVVLVDSQDTGVRLVHTLLACAEAVQQNNLELADALLKHIGLLAASQAGAMRKVATYFAEALARRIYRIHPRDCLDSSYTDLLQMHFYESCPYLKFAHFTANQAILEAFSTASQVHVIDFSLQQGLQWPALIQALALRPGGPPLFRLTGIGPPQPLDDTDALQQVGWKLAQLADAIGVKFEFRGFFCNSLADLEPEMLDLRPADVETVAVNSVFELHQLLARPGAIEKVLYSIKALNPKIVTVVEQVANHNGPVFLDRFTEALHYYSSLFDSLEGSAPSTGLTTPSQDVVMSEVYLARQICNVVACEGPDRVERHETLDQWRDRFGSAGFDLVHLGSNAFKQASTLLALFAGGDGYRVEESNGCLMLGWHTRPLIATSTWSVSSDSSDNSVIIA